MIFCIVFGILLYNYPEVVAPLLIIGLFMNSAEGEGPASNYDEKVKRFSPDKMIKR